MAGDSDPQAAKLALDTLVEMGQVVKRRILGLAQQPTAPMHAGIEAYLARLLGQPFIYIPPGKFIMGSDPLTDPLAEPHEQPQHQLSLPGYWLARYPLTTAHFRIFVQAQGYKPRGSHYLAGEDDFPVIDVTWYDALAYCRWLGEQSGLPLTLPSEAQWEKAARGSDGRRYPWGNMLPTATLCNFQPTPIGYYSPQGDSPYGCADMAGNVWEWTRSAYQPYPYQPSDGREDIEPQQARVVRGLTFNDLARYTRCACRYALKQNLHLLTLGFRVAVVPQ
jgi:formylglycine-generating enzyme required for sulfatase activity